ncbi:MAG: flagellar biosynthetic protein FliO [Planctomycetes bacterium]|nr:flagellar biosynthetic protein FliO [Planctomycetota bacterium]
MQKCYHRFLIGLACGLLAATATAADGAGRGYPIRSAGTAPTGPVATRSVETPPPAPAPAPAAAATGKPDATAYEHRPLTFAGDARREARGDGARLPSVWPALGLVTFIGLAFALAMLLIKKFLPGHRHLFSHPAMEILGRTHIDQRRYVSLLRVGRRIVVVGVSPDEMRTLSEIADEEEVTDILEVARPKTDHGLSLFQRLFQRHVLHNEEEETRALAEAQAEALSDQMASLRDRVRTIQKGEKPARRVDAVG